MLRREVMVLACRCANSRLAADGSFTIPATVNPALRHASIDAIVPLMPAYAGPQLVAHVAQLEAATALALPGVAALRATLKVPEKI